MDPLFWDMDPLFSDWKGGWGVQNKKLDPLFSTATANPGGQSDIKPAIFKAEVKCISHSNEMNHHEIQDKW